MVNPQQEIWNLMEKGGKKIISNAHWAMLQMPDGVLKLLAIESGKVFDLSKQELIGLFAIIEEGRKHV